MTTDSRPIQYSNNEWGSHLRVKGSRRSRCELTAGGRSGSCPPANSSPEQRYVRAAAGRRSAGEPELWPLTSDLWCITNVSDPKRKLCEALKHKLSYLSSTFSLAAHRDSLGRLQKHVTVCHITVIRPHLVFQCISHLLANSTAFPITIWFLFLILRILADD